MWRNVRQTKTQISLRICAVWSESSFGAWRNFASLVIQSMPSEDSEQITRMLGAPGRRYVFLSHRLKHITKTRLFKYIENFTSKNWFYLHKKKLWHFSYFCSKQRLWVLVRTASEAVLTSTQKSMGFFFQKNKKNNVYPCQPQFYYIKVGLKGVKIIQARFRDEFY